MQASQVSVDIYNLSINSLDVRLNIFDIIFDSVQFVCYLVFQVSDVLCCRLLKNFNGRFILTDQSFQSAFTVDFIPKFLNLVLCSFDSFLCSFDVFCIRVGYFFYTFSIQFQSVELSLQVLVCCDQCFDSILSSFDSFCVFFHSAIGQITQTSLDTFNLSTECFNSSFVNSQINLLVDSALQ